MSFAAGAGWCAAGLAILVLAGCGASASPAERQARCFEKHRDDTASISIAVPGKAWEAAVHRICAEASREAKLPSSGALSGDDAKSIARRHPRVLYPICEENAIQERDRADPGVAKYLPAPMLRRLARHYCDVVMASGLGFDADGLTGADRNSIARRHPAFLAAFCVAGANLGYDKERHHVLTRSDLRKVMARVCVKAVRRGYIRPDGGSNDAAVKALAKNETLRMIHRGEIHFLSST
jgi:hypothetical protein